jgi:hypothetical protein
MECSIEKRNQKLKSRFIARIAIGLLFIMNKDKYLSCIATRVFILHLLYAAAFFKIITFFETTNMTSYFGNATACSKRKLKTIVATYL